MYISKDERAIHKREEAVVATRHDLNVEQELQLKLQRVIVFGRDPCRDAMKLRGSWRETGEGRDGCKPVLPTLKLKTQKHMCSY
jgi:hypothetical protein